MSRLGPSQLWASQDVNFKEHPRRCHLLCAQNAAQIRPSKWAGLVGASEMTEIWGHNGNIWTTLTFSKSLKGTPPVSERNPYGANYPTCLLLADIPSRLSGFYPEGGASEEWMYLTLVVSSSWQLINKRGHKLFFHWCLLFTDKSF